MESPSWFRRDIRLGDSGPDVRIVRRKLGFIPDGEYDLAVEERVRGLARKRKVQSEGEVNKAVAGELGESATHDLPPSWFSRELELWFEGDDVRRARELLQLGSAREVRGENRYDPEMEKAVRRFQSANRLRPTGRLDEATARCLGGDD